MGYIKEPEGGENMLIRKSDPDLTVSHAAYGGILVERINRTTNNIG
jgi:hypothetical protein